MNKKKNKTNKVEPQANIDEFLTKQLAEGEKEFEEYIKSLPEEERMFARQRQQMMKRAFDIAMFFRANEWENYRKRIIKDNGGQPIQPQDEQNIEAIFISGYLQGASLGYCAAAEDVRKGWLVVIPEKKPTDNQQQKPDLN